MPLIPMWEGKQIAAVRDGVTGVEETFDPAFLFRFWLVSKELGGRARSATGARRQGARIAHGATTTSLRTYALTRWRW